MLRCFKQAAPVVELVDTRDLKSCAKRRAGSIPAGGTNMEKRNEEANDAEAEEGMSKWKMVPMELTPAMVDAIDTGRTDSAGSIYYNLLAAAPEWEPSDEDVERWRAIAAQWKMPLFPSKGDIRAALKAAVGGGS